MTNDNAVWLFEQPNYTPRQELLDWLRANNLDPDRIPVDATITVNEHAQTVTTDTVVYADGKPVIDGSTVARRPVTVPLVTAPPHVTHHRLTFTDAPDAKTRRRP
ncbi:hypothetical protein ACIBCR_15015 [Micromonospora echinospora]|uniref:hypothetical protein n=1 Tax=Micromonospora echinospora TaxID=1877 RepID=UPI0037B671E4